MSHAMGVHGVGAAAASELASTARSGIDGAARSGAGGTPATPFSGVLRSVIEQTSDLDARAAQSVTGLLNGSGVEVHDALIATQKANMAFELALQLRNKAVGAYQQMLNMQF